MTEEREHLLDSLKTLYKERRIDIQRRLEEFKQALDKDEIDVFAELSFCILTPQSEAKTCWEAVLKLREKSVLSRGTPSDIEACLHQVRFYENKARYIVQARNQFTKDSLRLKEHIQSFYNRFELREWFVDNVKGLGYKEASHFLRNIGLGEEFAILDRHILRNLGKLGIIEEVPVSLTKRKYLDIEGRLRRFSKEIGIPMAELDLLFWSKETGWIFK
ncbi:MAG TPA: N-glycosylase/DNA lyase [Candidatus Binatus sp.]|nr:N-glycosylase/DNA lyase [Candidatus Binatus sp.]